MENPGGVIHIFITVILVNSGSAEAPPAPPVPATMVVVFLAYWV